MIPTKEEMRQALEKRQGKELQQHFFSATVAICGLGGLGSNIAISLARAGVGKLILIDFDKVDVTNLHRQQYKASQIGRYKTEALSENLKEIAPYVELETHTTRMTEQNVVELLKEADVICEAFDDAQAKAMLTNSVLEIFHRNILWRLPGWLASAVQTVLEPDRSQNVFICAEMESATWEMTLDLSLRA